MNFSITNLRWINKPERFHIDDEKIIITTQPGTDLWQNTMYGINKANSPALTISTANDFCFVVKGEFESNVEYDQCGVIIYINEENWFKSYVQCTKKRHDKLSSIVTNNGHSDWTGFNLAHQKRKKMYYRLTRKGMDFSMENSVNGVNYNKTRIFHLDHAQGSINFGVYASSPIRSSFNAIFTDFNIL